LLIAACSLALASAGGCISASQSRLVRVEPEALPKMAPAHPPGALAAVRPKLPILAANGEPITGPQAEKLLAAREAFWSFDTETAVKLLRELRRDDVLDPEQFHWLLLQCYEQSDRWAETLPLFDEFGLASEHPAWFAYSKFRAGLPRREFEFAREPTSIPFALKHGDLIIAEAEINGVTARLLIDTGASMSWLAESFARTAQTEPGAQTISLNDANDRPRETPLGLIHELRIGGVTVRNTPALIGRSTLLQLNAPVDGILGWDILQHIDMTWDFPAKRMTLAEPRGPVSVEPNLSGRIGPILKLVSETGRPLHVFFDSGAHAGRACIDFYEQESERDGEAPLAEFRRGWRPTVSMAMHSVTFAWPRFAEQVAFWMAGHRFEVPRVALYKRGQQQERLVSLNGVVGNALFLGGRLRVCGVRRLVEFELGKPTTAGAGSVVAAKN
jgi:hypothetical protein